MGFKDFKSTDASGFVFIDIILYFSIFLITSLTALASCEVRLSTNCRQPEVKQTSHISLGISPLFKIDCLSSHLKFIYSFDINKISCFNSKFLVDSILEFDQVALRQTFCLLSFWLKRLSF